jgi:hypothetical protein
VAGDAQLELWEGGTAIGRYGGTAALQGALDSIHSNFGAHAVVSGGRLSPTAVPSYRRTAHPHHTPTILPKVALSSRARCASAS